jgi:hypothetical protein
MAGEFSFLCSRSFVIQSRNMRRSYLFGIYLLFFALLSLSTEAGTYTLLNGETLTGDPISFNETGLIVKKSDGSFSPRTPWEKLSQDSLKFLKAEAPSQKEKDFIEPFIEESAQSESHRREIIIKEVAKPARPTGDVGLSAAFSSPLFVLIFLVVYLANIYAAYEIAFYKNYLPMMVCGVSAVAPFVGPIVFLCMPAKADPMRDTTADAPPAEPPPVEEAPVEETHGTAAPLASEIAADESNPLAPSTSSIRSSLKIAHEEPAPAARALPAPVVFKRGEFSFNRRFFETKMPGFFRVVPGEAEKDMVISIKAARGEFTGKRITRVTQNELFLQVFKDEATHDEMIPFTEIQEVSIRHKDAA